MAVRTFYGRLRKRYTAEDVQANVQRRMYRLDPGNPPAGPGPDPTIVNTASGTAATATVNTSFTAATAGNLLVLVVAADDFKTADPSGWTLPTGGGQQQNLGHYLWYKIAAGGETSASYTINSATGSVWQVTEYDHVAAFDVSNGTSAATSGTTFATPSVTPSSGRRFAIATVGGSLGAKTITDLSSWTNSFVQQPFRNVNATPQQVCFEVSTLALDGGVATSTTATYVGGTPETRTAILAVFTVAAGGGAAPVEIPPVISQYTGFF